VRRSIQTRQPSLVALAARGRRNLNTVKLKQPPALLGRAPSRLKSPPKFAEQFYLSREWRSLVASVKRERGNYCQRCGSTHRVAADHIVERRDGGLELDASNIELLCQPCHNAKTKRQAAARANERG
jgi:5-methylcytosine-specific restriction protein A